jgi:hypothetical protein
MNPIDSSIVYTFVRHIVARSGGRRVLDEIAGLPVHVLIIHVTVVFLPLLAAAAIVYALVPRLRSKIGWAAVLLAIGGPLCAFLARQSGGSFRARLVAQGVTGPLLDRIDKHQSYGNLTFWYALGLGVATLVLVVLTTDNARMPTVPTWVSAVVGVVVIGFAVATGIYVFLTGDSGAHAVWDGVLSG